MKNAMKTVYVKIPFFRETAISLKTDISLETDVSLERMRRTAVHDFLKMNNYNIRYITSDIMIDPISLQYCVAILFRV